MHEEADPRRLGRDPAWAHHTHTTEIKDRQNCVGSRDLAKVLPAGFWNIC